MFIKSYIKQNKLLKKPALWITRNIFVVFKNINFLYFFRAFSFIKDYLKFLKLGGRAKFIDLYPCLSDKTKTSTIDTHYFYQAIWGFNRIMKYSPRKHVDVGSDVNFVGMLTNITHVSFVDIRPLKLNIKNYKGLEGSILNLPFKDNSINSLSCFHVIEHIGLGRYGDDIDPDGSIKAAEELKRVLQKDGFLFITIPMGIKSVQFNSQRIFSYKQVIDIFSELKLIEFSVVNMNGNFLEKIDIKDFSFDFNTGQDAGLGMFIFKKNISKKIIKN